MDNKQVRFGIAGLGIMGATHARNLLAGKAPRGVLAAVSDAVPERLSAFGEVARFESAEDMMRSGKIDAILIATPHYAHTSLGIAALEAGLHVLVEKPVSVHKADAERLIAAHRNPNQVFAAMFNQRTDGFFRKIRDFIGSGELGRVQRIQWTITHWFRSHAYYASSPWRATWAGEGGGVLLNQCPHQLDLFCWLFGVPERVRAFCHFGKYHEIEVEDEVTAYLEYKGGATGVFITSTGEAPGTNRLEVAGDRGRLVYEADRLTFLRNETPASMFSRTTRELFSLPETWDVKLPDQTHGGQHIEIIQNFIAAILDSAPLIAPAAEGMHSVELANAMLLSTWLDRTIELPIDSALYAAQLEQRCAPAR